MSKFIKSSIITIITNMFNLFIGMLITIIIARILGPINKGIYTLALLLPTTILTFVNLGIGPATVYFINKRKVSVNVVIQNNLSLVIILSFISFFLGHLLINLYKNVFFEGVSTTYLYMSLFMIPFMLFNNFFSAIFQALEKFVYFNLVNLVNKLSIIILLVIIFYIKKVSLLILINIFALVASNIVLFFILKKMSYKIKINFNMQYLLGMFKYSTKIHLSNIITFLNYRLDMILVNYFINPLAVGYYSIAVNISEKIWILSQSTSKVLLPRIAKLKSNESKQVFTAKVSRIMFIISFFIVIIFYFASNLIIPLLFSKDYLASITPLKILLVGILPVSFSKLLSNDLAGRGFPEYNAYISFTSTCVNIALNLFLIPKYGIIGAAISTAVSYNILAILTTYIYCKISKNNILNILFIKKSDFNYLYKLLRYTISNKKIGGKK